MKFVLTCKHKHRRGLCGPIYGSVINIKFSLKMVPDSCAYKLLNSQIVSRRNYILVFGGEIIKLTIFVQT